MMPVNMSGYPSVCKTAHHVRALAELEFAMHTCAQRCMRRERAVIVMTTRRRRGDQLAVFTYCEQRRKMNKIEGGSAATDDGLSESYLVWREPLAHFGCLICRIH
jgi:hypothetical protein